MGEYYRKKEPTGREYVDRTSQFCDVTIYRCMQLPKRWYDTLLKPMILLAQEIESCVVQANAIYINEKSMSPEQLAEAYGQRDAYLVSALQKFADYDIKFERLMRQVDIAGSEKRRLKNILLGLIDEARAEKPDLQRLEISVTARMDEMEYYAAGGTRCMKLKLTARNKDHWLDLENQARDLIRNRISADKKAVTRHKA